MPILTPIQQCPALVALSAYTASQHSTTPSLLQRSFAVLFPFTSPAYNSMLATLYISGPPNFLLALCPTDIDPASLNVMVAFAVGGLLGDTLFHLLPEIFLGEVPEGTVRAVLVEPNKNLLLGVAILVGFVTFVAMDKGLRIATGGAGHSHDHAVHEKAETIEEEKPSNGAIWTESHGYITPYKLPALDTPSSTSTSSTPSDPTSTTSTTTGTVLANTSIDSLLRQRSRSQSNASSLPPASTPPPVPSLPVSSHAPTRTPPTQPKAKKEANPSIKLSAYLNIIADFTHNITDGLALSSSFYASPTIGATTTLAVFCHEIPHEVGDFALLIQGGMSKRTAMGLQFVTALGAVLGTAIGVAVQEFGGAGAASSVNGGIGNQGIWGTSLSAGDLLLPFTAGTFLYVGTVGVIPEMLETGPDRWKELKSMGMQFAALAAGAGIMLA